MTERNESKNNKFIVTSKSITIFAILVILILSLAITSNSMIKPISRDEQMYCTGAYLIAQGKMIYRDYSYIAQMPYHPLLYASVYKITGTKYYLLTGRIISTICDILVMICIFGIYRSVFKSSIISGTLLGLGAAVIYVFNPLVDYANGYAWNHDVVILCVMLSLWLFILTDFNKKSSFWLTAAMGVLLTFAACMRITTFLVVLLFLLILLSLPAASIKQRIKTASPFIAASILVLIWPVWIIAHAPKAFYLNLFKIPTLNGKWLHEIGMVYDKLDLTIASLTTPGYFILMFLVVYLWVTIFFLRHNLKINDKPKVFLTTLLPLVFFITAFIPPTMWKQYLAVPVPFILASLAFPFMFLQNQSSIKKLRKYYKISIVIIVIGFLVSVATYPVVIQRIPAVIVPEVWTPIEVHRIANDIANEMVKPGLILTLAPLYAIEGGCNIYTELSCGSFVYRIADLLSAEERRITKTIGPKSLPELVSEKPPSVVITNVDMEFLDKTIFDSAVDMNWRKKEYENGPTVYFRTIGW